MEAGWRRFVLKTNKIKDFKIIRNRNQVSSENLYSVFVLICTIKKILIFSSKTTFGEITNIKWNCLGQHKFLEILKFNKKYNLSNEFCLVGFSYTQEQLIRNLEPHKTPLRTWGGSRKEDRLVLRRIMYIYNKII